MKKILALSTALVVASVFALFAIAADAPQGPFEITNYGKKAAVTFDHANHQLDCKTCHHNEGGFKCGECHGEKDEGSKPSLKNAAHGRKEASPCYRCHNKKSSEVKKALGCKDCHKK